MRYINSKDERTTKSLKRPDLSYLHLYLVLLTLVSVVKTASGWHRGCPTGYYSKYSNYNFDCIKCDLGTYQPINYEGQGSLIRQCTNCVAGKYCSRYVCYTCTRFYTNKSYIDLVLGSFCLCLCVYLNAMM